MENCYLVSNVDGYVIGVHRTRESANWSVTEMRKEFPLTKFEITKRILFG